LLHSAGSPSRTNSHPSAINPPAILPLHLLHKWQYSLVFPPETLFHVGMALILFLYIWTAQTLEKRKAGCCIQQSA